MPGESRADYFKKRRHKYKTFSVSIEREKMERFERHLQSESKSKAQWLNSKIDEELGQKK